MTYLGDKDFLIEVARGNVSGGSLVHKFGRNPGVPNGSFEFIGQISGAITFLSAATTVRIAGGGAAADTATGANARSVTVVGLATTLAEVSETINTTGTAASSSSSTAFWRVYRAYVEDVGTYGAANATTVTIETTSGTDLIKIGAGLGQSEHCAYSVPTGKSAYLLSITVQVDAAKAADVVLYQRRNFNDVTAPMPGKRIVYYFDGILGELKFVPRSPVTFPALTDIWMEAQGGGAGTEVSAEFELLLI